MNPERLQIIREALQSLAACPRAARDDKPAPRPVFGCRNHARAALPTGWIERRHAVIAGAIAYLNAHGRFVQVVDRAARVRLYRVSGKLETMLAEEMVRLAATMGFDADNVSSGGQRGPA